MPRSPGKVVESWLRERIEQEERHRRMDVDLDWRLWARQRLAPYWYGLLAVFLDIAVVATILGALRGSGASAYGIVVACLVFLVYAEFVVYGRLWPSGEVVVAREERRAVKARKLRVKAVENPAAGEARGAPKDPAAPSGERGQADAVLPETHE